MGKGKLKKFAEMAENPLVVECPYGQLQREGFPLRGRWHEDFFHNSNPIVLELGCGRGEYTIGLGRLNPECNYIGVDIKGSRMWHGAREALAEGMQNVGFLRTNIECIDQLFAEDEVSEIWLTFSDPQMKKPTKRLTSTWFLERYRRFLVDGGFIHLKTDSNFLYTYTRLMAEHNQLEIMEAIESIEAMETIETMETIESMESIETMESMETMKSMKSIASIQTYYEQMWRSRGIPIKYLCFKLSKHGPLEESGIEIEMDDYRSYDHEFVKQIKTTL